MPGKLECKHDFRETSVKQNYTNLCNFVNSQFCEQSISPSHLVKLAAVHASAIF